MDRCEVLLSARLAAEARANAEAAVAELEAAGLGADLAEARLLAAQAELLPATSPAHDQPPGRPAFSRQHRPAGPRWRGAAARAAWMEAERAPARARPRPARRRRGASGAAARRAGARRGRRAARRERRAGERASTRRGARLEAALAAAQRALRALEAAGWGVEALDARLIAGRAALELGRPRLARRQLELAAAARHAGPVQVRTRAWHAAALLRLSHGDRRGASAAVAAGLRALEAHRMTLGATELRAHASGPRRGARDARAAARGRVRLGARACSPPPSAGARPGCCCGPRARRTSRARRRAGGAAPRDRRARRVAARGPPERRARSPPGRAGALGPPPRAARARRGRQRALDDRLPPLARARRRRRSWSSSRSTGGCTR